METMARVIQEFIGLKDTIKLSGWQENWEHDPGNVRHNDVLKGG